MCAPLIAAIPLIGSALTTAGTAASVAGVAGATTTAAATAATFTAANVMTALSIASAAMSFGAQRSAAKAQNAAISAQQKSEASEARDKQEEELGVTIKAQREARSRATVAAGESGALGASFMASINQSIQDQDMDIALASKNLATSQRATADRANTARAGIQNPSALEGGLSIASAGVTGYRSGLEITRLRDGN